MTKEETVEVICTPCPVCGKQARVQMPVQAFVKWDEGRGDFIQRAWPEASAGDRELLISGTHPDCFDKLFPPEEQWQ